MEELKKVVHSQLYGKKKLFFKKVVVKEEMCLTKGSFSSKNDEQL